MPNYIQEAGAIVLRKQNDQPEVLLIFSKKQPKIRIFPKGHIESGESPAQAAQRELGEEAGVTGQLLEQAGIVTFDFKGKSYRVTYFYFRFLDKASDGEPGRDPTWFPVSAVGTVLSLEHLRKLVTPEPLERILSRL